MNLIEDVFCIAMPIFLLVIMLSVINIGVYSLYKRLKNETEN